MRRRSVWGIVGIMLAVTAGCRHRDLVEAELRYESRRARQLQRELCQRQAEVHTLQSMLSERPANSTSPADSPETVYRREAMSRVSLGMTTGARDLDRDGRPDAVQFTIICHDYDGDAFKCPGSAEVALDAILDNGSKSAAGSWQIDSDKLRETWKSSLLGAGYQIVMPIAGDVNAKRWKARVKFTTLDGRVFEDEKEFQMKLEELPKEGAPGNDPPESSEKGCEPPRPPEIIPTAGRQSENEAPRVRFLSPVVD